mmetsp:Transcript_2361/g.9584  ORF Transcript_2361/g.9584 Transcript_2361/m.9584 type:complete len:216 (+) Transcript_2361:1564-2211(+)
MDPRPGKPTAAKPPSGCCCVICCVPSCRRFGGLGPGGRGGCCCCIEGGGPGGRGGGWCCCCCIGDGALAKISCPYGDDSTESPAAVAVASAASPVGDRSDCSECVGDAAAGLGGVIQSSPASFPWDALVRMGLPANVTFGVGSCSGLGTCDVAGCSSRSRSSRLLRGIKSLMTWMRCLSLSVSVLPCTSFKVFSWRANCASRSTALRLTRLSYRS